MSSYQRITLTLPNATTNNFVSQTNFHSGMGSHEGLRGLINYLKAIDGGIQQGNLSITTGATYGTATITVSAGGSANNETATICGITITAKTSGADTTAAEFNISATAATQAANMVTMFTNTTDFDGLITAAAVAGVVTLTAAAPGAIGNALQAADVNLANVAISDFVTEDTGADGTTYTITLS